MFVFLSIWSVQASQRVSIFQYDGKVFYWQRLCRDCAAVCCFIMYIGKTTSYIYCLKCSMKFPGNSTPRSRVWVKLFEYTGHLIVPFNAVFRYAQKYGDARYLLLLCMYYLSAHCHHNFVHFSTTINNKNTTMLAIHIISSSKTNNITVNKTHTNNNNSKYKICEHVRCLMI